MCGSSRRTLSLIATRSRSCSASAASRSKPGVVPLGAGGPLRPMSLEDFGAAIVSRGASLTRRGYAERSLRRSLTLLACTIVVRARSWASPRPLRVVLSHGAPFSCRPQQLVAQGWGAAKEKSHIHPQSRPRFELGDKVSRRENHTFGDAGRTLSALAGTNVVPETARLPIRQLSRMPRIGTGMRAPPTMRGGTRASGWWWRGRPEDEDCGCRPYRLTA
jgi:hypothetical protein